MKSLFFIYTIFDYHLSFCIVKEKIKASLLHYYPGFHALTEDDIKKLASLLYSKGLITAKVKKFPTAYNIYDELIASLSSTCTFSKLKKYYQTFLNCLSSMDGPTQALSTVFAEEFENILQEGKCYLLSIHYILSILLVCGIIIHNALIMMHL